jgi:hypothetical protein
MKMTNAFLLSAALTGMLSGASIAAQAASTNGNGVKAVKAGVRLVAQDTTKHSCKGQNACKGQGGCKSSDNGCKGKNSCKSKGGCATDGSKAPAPAPKFS